MEKRDLSPGDVVQIDPASGGFFGGCFMLVTEPKPFGAQGFVSVPGARGEPPGSAYYRAKWEEMEYIGRAAWAPAPEVETP